ncbi:glycerophosphodiester phosphodiesterase [Lactobacillus acetotolerans]|uniref:glycerophosphodiester phosphodiesterase n=1 Tax=Lactobacillus acetotolerans TaxID=1600 RepID=UPI0019D0875B|nr:glycerophosphodiester phosphodiesterase [Lactobacillus acetotolerans]MBN7275829.1 glycerophosphodiester phosphodiesterase [Lactobacillus acetotolerans]
MKTAIKDIEKYAVEFKRHFWSYLLLFLSLDLFNQYLMLPLFYFLNTYIFQAISVPFSSLQYVVTVVTHHPFLCLLLLIELFFLLWLLYIEFSFLLIGISDICNGSNLKIYFKRIWQIIKTPNITELLLILMYLLLLEPIVEVIFRTPLLSRVKMADFIFDYMTRTPILVVILIIFYILFIFLGIRLIFVLPKMILKREKFTDAIKESWQITKNGQWWDFVSNILVLLLFSIVLLFATYFICYSLQIIWDIFPRQFSFIMANVDLFLIQLASLLGLACFIWIDSLILLKPLSLKFKKYNGKSNQRKLLFTVAALFLLSSLVVIDNNSSYLNNSSLKRPLLISHRGVSDKNGVQNTLPVLRKTAKMKPDLVEMDIHETKDNKFVVLHDANLNKLIRINKKPGQLTLRELTKLTARENGHKAKITSFGHYLKIAESLKQKLLVEIKTTPTDSPDMLQLFNRRYGKTILKRHYQIHSMDYRVVTGLHKINPKLSVFYIQPYNFIYPRNVAAGYSMEFSTLNYDFIKQAHQQGKLVYVWTVDNPNVMKKMLYDHVDGLITNNLEEAKVAVRQYEHNLSYANYLLNYIMTMPV